MKLRRALSILIVLSAVVFAAQNVFAQERWIKARSKNFQLIGNTSEVEIRQTALNLERFREVFHRLSGLESYDSSIPIYIVVFKSDDFFRDYKPANREGKLTDWAEGYFVPGENVNYIALSIKGDKSTTYQTIFHEYVHYLTDIDIGRSKALPWLNEGLAEYYQLLHIENDQKAIVGGVNQAHLRLLRQNKLMPFETFFNHTYHTLNLQSKETAQLFYAQAWALTHYLLQGNDAARNARFLKFIESLKTRKPAKDAFRELFTVDFNQLDRELTDYINQKNFGATTVNFSNSLKFSEQIETSAMKDSEAKIVLGDLLLHINRVDVAAVHLEEALKSDENSSLANISLGLVRLRQKNFADAIKHLEKAVKLDENNYLAHYQLAFVMSREEMSEYGFVSGYDFQKAEKMREALRKAIALNPDFAQSYNLYAFISIVRNEEIEQAAEYMKKASALAPGNQWYQIRTAEILMRKEDFSNARQIAQRIFQTAPDEELRVYAMNRISLINSLESQLESLKKYNESLKNEVPDKILTDEEFAVLREQAILESINQSLRRPVSNEIRVLGHLTKVECCENAVEYVIKVDGRTLKLTSKNFENLNLVSFSKEMNNVQLGCESVKNESFAVITYLPLKNAAQTAGEILSIEFVPQNFKFKN